MAQPGNKNKGEKEEAIERKYKAFEFRKSGMSYRDIGKELDISGGQAYQDVMWVLKTIINDHKEDVEQYKQMELERLDEYVKSLDWKKNMGNFKTIEIMLKIQDRRAKLLGLDAPQKTALTDPSGQKEFTGLIVLPEKDGKNGGKGNGKNNKRHNRS